MHRSQTGVLALLPLTAVWIYFVLHRSQISTQKNPRFGSISFCIGLKLIEVKARISAMSGGISFYIGLKPLFKQVVDTERFGYISFYIGLKP